MSDQRSKFLKNRRKQYIMKAIHGGGEDWSFRDDLQGVFFTGPCNDIHAMATAGFSALRTYTGAISDVETILNSVSTTDTTTSANKGSAETAVCDNGIDKNAMQKERLLDKNDNEIDADLAKEINVLRSGNNTTSGCRNRFYKIKPNVKGSIFVGWPRLPSNASPDKAVEQLIRAVMDSGANIKNLARAIPILHTCKYAAVSELREEAADGGSDTDKNAIDHQNVVENTETNELAEKAIAEGTDKNCENACNESNGGSSVNNITDKEVNEVDSKTTEKSKVMKETILNDALLKTQLHQSIEKALLSKIADRTKLQQLTKIIYADIKIRNNSAVQKQELVEKVAEWMREKLPYMGTLVTNDNRFAKFTLFVQINQSWALTGAIISDGLCDCSLTAAMKKFIENHCSAGSSENTKIVLPAKGEAKAEDKEIAETADIRCVSTQEDNLYDAAATEIDIF